MTCPRSRWEEPPTLLRSPEVEFEPDVGEVYTGFSIDQGLAEMLGDSLGSFELARLISPRVLVDHLSLSVHEGED